jgi:hypothetical protein
MFTAMSTWRRIASPRQVCSAAPTPRLILWLITDAPAPRASAAVSSVEPSSTTSTSTWLIPGSWRGMRAITSAMVAASFSAGSMTRRRFGSLVPSFIESHLACCPRSVNELAPILRHREGEEQDRQHTAEHDPEPARADALSRGSADGEGHEPRDVQELDR